MHNQISSPNDTPSMAGINKFYARQICQYLLTSFAVLPFAEHISLLNDDLQEPCQLIRHIAEWAWNETSNKIDRKCEGRDSELSRLIEIFLTLNFDLTQNSLHFVSKITSDGHVIHI